MMKGSDMAMPTVSTYAEPAVKAVLHRLDESKRWPELPEGDYTICGLSNFRGQMPPESVTCPECLAILGLSETVSH